MNRVFVTLMTKSYFLPCIIRQAQRLSHLQSKYDYLVLVTDNVEATAIQQLKDNHILYKIVPFFKLTGEKITYVYEDTICKLYMLTLTDYDEFIFIDGDTLCINNIDYWFDKLDFSSHNLSTCLRIDDKNYAEGTILWGKPDIQLFNCAKELLNKNPNKYKDDEYLYNDLLARGLMGGDVCDFFRQDFIHFSGIIKLWMLKDYKNVNILFYTASAEKFNLFMDKYGTFLIAFALYLEQASKEYISNCDHFLKIYDICTKDLSMDWKNFFIDEVKNLS